jgi:hypothetical protein
LRWPRTTLYPQKLAQTSPTSGGRSVGMVRSRTKATEFTLRSKDNDDFIWLLEKRILQKYKLLQ